MKKILLLASVAVLFLACDYAQDAVELKPDIEIVRIDPISAYTSVGDTAASVTINEVTFVPENSVDCYLDKLIWEYVDGDGNQFYGPEEVAMYLKIEGKKDSVEVDSFYITGIYLPLFPIHQNIGEGECAEVLLHFVFIDEYLGGTDTATAWFGVYVVPNP